MKVDPLPCLAVRGPTEHAVRDRIVEAAHSCFAHYGYQKTAVADLARRAGFSKAYIYRFFSSKQAIGEAICQSRLDQLISEANKAMMEGESASDRFRRMFSRVTELSVRLFFEDRKLHEIAALAALENWEVAHAYKNKIKAIIKELVEQGRMNGEFERKTPLDETCRSIFFAMKAFIDPLYLEHNLEGAEDAQNEVINMILRSLKS